VLVAEADSDGAGGVDDLSVGVHGFQMADGIGNTHRFDSFIPQTNHFAESSRGDQVDGGHAETSGQDAVERGRGTAALDVSQHADPHVLLRSPRNGIADPIRHCARPTIFLPFHRHLDALGHHDNGKALAVGLAQGYVLADFVDGERDLGNQDDVGAAGDPCFEGDPTGVSPHDFHDHDAMVRFRCGVDFVDCVSRGYERGIETECDFGGGEVVVDGLGHAYDLHALLEKVQSDLLGAVAANADHGVDSELAGVGDDFVGNVADDLRAVLDDLVVKRIAAIGGAKDGAAAGQDSADVLEGKWPGFFRPDQAIEAVGNADDPPVIFENGRLDGGTDDRIQTGGVAAPGTNADAADVRH